MRSILVIVLLAFLSPTVVTAQQFERTIDGRSMTFEEVYYNDFESGLDDWLSEGGADVHTDGRRLIVDAREGMVTIWCRKEFSGPQLVEYDVRLMSTSMESNVNMFLLAGNPDARGILATTGERDGTYAQYHRFPNYLVTILNAPSSDKREQLRIRMRLDPGFELVEERWGEPLIFGKVYHVGYLIEPPKVTVLIDGDVMCSAVYDATLSAGLHGLRIWRTYSIYDNFRVSRVVEK